ncbi:UNVERIFIED_CONTAM: MACPF domain-containing protein [Sesamum angustifolium]|uniref:MACPF domain-containing protein n=1 Tax=Sesamum angustifolium TaxID=2727405 RepID=A0AAW2PTP9_9LAMI
MFLSLQAQQDYEKRPIEVRATEALGQGFDLASDFRLKFVKRCPNGGRLVVLDEQRKRDVVVPGGVMIPSVPECIRVDKGDHIRFKSDVLQFNQVAFEILKYYIKESKHLEEKERYNSCYVDEANVLREWDLGISKGYVAANLVQWLN